MIIYYRPRYSLKICVSLGFIVTYFITNVHKIASLAYIFAFAEHVFLAVGCVVLLICLFNSLADLYPADEHNFDFLF